MGSAEDGSTGEEAATAAEPDDEVAALEIKEAEAEAEAEEE